MTKKEINENNKFIAEFMNIPCDEKGIYRNSYELMSRFPQLYYSRRDLYFHNNWDWLMPVVRKCVEITMKDDPVGTELFHSDEYSSILDTVPLAIIEDVYKVTIEFIKRYNNESKTNT